MLTCAEAMIAAHARLPSHDWLLSDEAEMDIPQRRVAAPNHHRDRHI